MIHTKTFIKSKLVLSLALLAVPVMIFLSTGHIEAQTTLQPYSQIVAAAQDPNKVPCTKDNCPLLQKYVTPTIELLSVLVGIAAVISIILGGIQISMSAGDPQKNASGKNHIRNAVIGIVALLFLYAFLNWVVPGGVTGPGSGP